MSNLTDTIRGIFERIRDERQTNANTATRIGNAFIILFDYLTGVDSPFLSREHDDTAQGALRFMKSLVVEGLATFNEGLISNDYTKFSEGADFGTFVQGLVGGEGARIDKNGNMEGESLRLRSYLEVPKLVYNHVDVRVGDEWQTNGAGDIESVYINDSVGHEHEGVIHLRLLKDDDGNITEYGTLKVGDRCKGIFHNMDGYNDSQTNDDGKGRRSFAGFFTSYFIITGVLGDHNEVLSYELRPTVTVGGEEFWMGDDALSSGVRGGFHPCAGMTFAQYSNPQDATRQNCQYRTTTYTRMLANMTGWDEGLKNIAFQVGNTPLIASAFNKPDAGRYSMWINGDIFFSGTLNRVDPWGRDVNDFPDQGFYDPTATYHFNDLVHHDGIVWRCINTSEQGVSGIEPGTDQSAWIKWIFADSVEPMGHWDSSRTPYPAKAVTNLYHGVYMSKRTTSNPPLGLKTTKTGKYLTTKDGGYIVFDNTVNEDWELLIDIGDITNGEDGQNAVAVNLTNDTDSVITDEKGNIPSGTTLPSTTAQLFDGLTQITEGVAWSIRSFSGCTATVDAVTGVCQVQTMTADNAEVIIVATYKTKQYAKKFSFKKLYGKDKLWLDMPEVVYYDNDIQNTGRHVSPSQLTIKAYILRYGSPDGEAETITNEKNLGYVKVGNIATKYYHGSTINLSWGSFTNGHLIINLFDANDNVQDTEDICLVQQPPTMTGEPSVSYALSNQGSDPSLITTWTDYIPQTLPEGMYLWTRSVITYTDGHVETKYSVGYMGEGFVSDGRWYTTTQVKKNHLYRFGNAIYVAKKDSVNVPPVASILRKKNGGAIKTKQGYYIIVDDSTNAEYYDKWVVDGNAVNAVRIDLDNENDTMLYDDNGNLLSGACVSHATLYDGNEKISNATISILSVKGCTASINVNTITVSDMTMDTGTVVVGCTYNGTQRTAVLSLKRIVNQDKFDIVCTPNAVAYNTTTSTVQAGGSIRIEVMRTPANGGARQTVQDLGSYGLTLACSPSGIMGAYSDGGATVAVSAATAAGNNNLIVTLSKNGKTVDSESIPILKAANGQKGDPGSPGTRGLQGCVTRVSEWKVGTEYRYDEDNAAAMIGFIDIVAMEDNSAPEGWTFYQCKVTHTSSASTKPGIGSEWSNKWIHLSNVGPLYTSLLIAKNALIKFGSGNQFVILDSNNKVKAGMKGDGTIRFWAGSNVNEINGDNNINDVPWRVYENGRMVSGDSDVRGTIRATVYFYDVQELALPVSGAYTGEIQTGKQIVFVKSPRNPTSGQNNIVYLPPVGENKGAVIEIYCYPNLDVSTSNQGILIQPNNVTGQTISDPYTGQNLPYVALEVSHKARFYCNGSTWIWLERNINTSP